MQILGVSPRTTVDNKEDLMLSLGYVKAAGVVDVILIFHNKDKGFVQAYAVDTKELWDFVDMIEIDLKDSETRRILELVIE